MRRAYLIHVHIGAHRCLPQSHLCRLPLCGLRHILVYLPSRPPTCRPLAGVCVGYEDLSNPSLTPPPSHALVLVCSSFLTAAERPDGVSGAHLRHHLQRVLGGVQRHRRLPPGQLLGQPDHHRCVPQVRRVQARWQLTEVCIDGALLVWWVGEGGRGGSWAPGAAGGAGRGSAVNPFSLPLLQPPATAVTATRLHPVPGRLLPCSSPLLAATPPPFGLLRWPGTPPMERLASLVCRPATQAAPTSVSTGPDGSNRQPAW